MDKLISYLRKYWHFLAGAVAILAFGLIYILPGANANAETPPEREIFVPNTQQVEEVPQNFYENYQNNQNTQNPDIVIHIAGAVYSPGVFTLSYGSRVNDALQLAGGATEYADLARVNLAAFLQDAQQIIIPAQGEEIEIVEATTGIGSTPEASSGLVNINTASQAQLMTLPGVGTVISGNIIAHREANGPFNNIDELRNVPRIGASTMENLRPLVTVN